jgi:hypothetical protein
VSAPDPALAEEPGPLDEADQGGAAVTEYLPQASWNGQAALHVAEEQAQASVQEQALAQASPPEQAQAAEKAELRVAGQEPRQQAQAAHGKTRRL